MQIHGINIHLNQHVSGGAIIPITSGGPIIEHQFLEANNTINGDLADTVSNGNTFTSPAMNNAAWSGVMHNVSGIGRRNPAGVGGAAAVINVGIADHVVTINGDFNNIVNSTNYGAITRWVDADNFYIGTVNINTDQVQLYVVTTASGFVSLDSALLGNPTINPNVVCTLTSNGTTQTFVYDVNGLTTDGTITLSGTDSSHAGTRIGAATRSTNAVADVSQNYLIGTAV